MRVNKHYFILIVFLLQSYYVLPQTTLFYQGFENAAVNCAENWGYSGGAVNNTTARTGAKSARVGRLGEDSVLTFQTINIASLTNVQLQIYHSVRSGSGPGMDAREGACMQVSLNGSAWTNIGQVGGSNDAAWGWNATTGGSAAVSPGCNIYQCANPLNYTIPAGTSSIAVRVISVFGGGVCATFNNNMNGGVVNGFNRIDEGFFIDDVKLTTTSDLSGIWTGAVSSNWFDCKNWYYNVLPTAATDVTIDQSAINPCVVDASGNAVCKNITVSSNNNSAATLTVQGGSSLTASGNVTVTKSAGSGVSKIEILGSNCSFICNNLTLSGTSSGAQNAQFLNAYHLNTITVNGNFSLQPGGQLNMNSVSDYGILNLKGNYLNNGLESDFIQTNSFVVLNGTGNQSISTNGFKEVFYNLVVNKTTGSVLLSSDINIENILNLQTGSLDLNTRTVTILNTTPSGIVRNGGGIISEKTNNSSRIAWDINTTQGIYIFPFIRTDAIYIPVTFENITGNAGTVSIATYGTGDSNLPWPTTPVAVSNLNNAAGQNDSSATVDRFWQIDVPGTPTANLTLSYAPDELPGIPFNNTSNIKAQNYVSNKWQAYMPSQTSGSHFVNIPLATTFSVFTLTNTSSPLPVSLLHFNAARKDDVVLVTWITASEESNDYFTIERSDDGQVFSEAGIKDGAGNSNSILYYSFEDKNPLKGLSYYRLRQTDYNGDFSLSKTVAVYDKMNSFSIFPNPVKNTLYIIPQENADYTISIVDLQGKLVMLENHLFENNLVAMDVKSLISGVYFLTITNRFSVSQSKFIKE